MGATITITQEEYDELRRAQRLLDHLYTTGVDNWEGFSAPQDDEEEDTKI